MFCIDFNPCSSAFSTLVPGEVFKILLGTILIILSIYFIFFNNKINIKPTFTSGLTAGGLGGILSGLFSTGGPPAVLYLSSAAPDNITYFATIQFYFCFTNIYGTSMRVINGIITTEILFFAAIGMVGCLIGDGIGRIIFSKLDSTKLKTIIYIGMIISGITMIV